MEGRVAPPSTPIGASMTANSPRLRSRKSVNILGIRTLKASEIADQMLSANKNNLPSPSLTGDEMMSPASNQMMKLKRVLTVIAEKEDGNEPEECVKSSSNSQSAMSVDKLQLGINTKNDFSMDTTEMSSLLTPNSPRRSPMSPKSILRSQYDAELVIQPELLRTIALEWIDSMPWKVISCIYFNRLTAFNMYF
jgi:hypothetical protein